ncbi:MAG: hypothetical protein ACO3Y3_08125 [Phycisphaerales bacterium]
MNWTSAVRVHLVKGLLAGAVAPAGLSASVAHADLYQWMNDSASYGYLCQYSIPNDLASESCVPTSTVNAFAYLQNTYATELGGVQLVGSGYAGWNATAQTLQGFFGTTQAGTSSTSAANGLDNYLSSIGAANLVTREAISATGDPAYPSWVTQNVVPTFGDFHGWMSSGAVVVVSIGYAQGGGHEITMVGLDWNDANGDGVVDESEGATFTVIDPLDPSEAYSGSDVLGPPKPTTISVWQSAAGELLRFSYQQYVGQLPFDAGNYFAASGVIGGGVSISVIPAPAAWIAALVAGACGSRRRR